MAKGTDITSGVLRMIGTMWEGTKPIGNRGWDTRPGINIGARVTSETRTKYGATLTSCT